MVSKGSDQTVRKKRPLRVFPGCICFCKERLNGMKLKPIVCPIRADSKAVDFRIFIKIVSLEILPSNIYSYDFVAIDEITINKIVGLIYITAIS